jgi:hypothetical protein
VADRWTQEEVLALAPDAAGVAAGRALAVPSTWSAAGADDVAVWGLCLGLRHEPYEVVVDLTGPAFRCSCPSRKVPCKHALGLLLVWADGHVPVVARPGHAAQWLAERAARAERLAREADRDGAPAAPSGPPRTMAPPSSQGGDAARDKRQAERAARVRAGLDELDRWLADQVRGGLTAPHLASYATWDAVAARLVDAQAGSLANRVRRVGALVGAGPGWHEQVLEELAMVHVLAVAGRRTEHLPPALAASVRQGLGWTVARDDVLAGVPVTDRWHVAGRSDTEEDRITVRRTWLWGPATRRWVMVLAFAAFGQALDATLEVGTTFVADVHPFPAALPLRALVGMMHEVARPDEVGPVAGTLADALAARAAALTCEPWLERWPATVLAVPARLGQGWCLADDTGALPVLPGVDVATLLAVGGAQPQPITVELHGRGARPVAVHPPGRTVAL